MIQGYPCKSAEILAHIFKAKLQGNPFWDYRDFAVQGLYRDFSLKGFYKIFTSKIWKIDILTKKFNRIATTASWPIGLRCQISCKELWVQTLGWTNFFYIFLTKIDCKSLYREKGNPCADYRETLFGIQGNHVGITGKPLFRLQGNPCWDYRENLLGLQGNPCRNYRETPVRITGIPCKRYRHIPLNQLKFSKQN